MRRFVQQSGEQKFATNVKIARLWDGWGMILKVVHQRATRWFGRDVSVGFQSLDVVVVC